MASGGKQTTESQQKETGTSTETSRSIIDPQVEQSILQGFATGANVLRDRISQPLDLKFQQGFSSQLDPVVSRAVSQGIQDIRARSAQQQNQAIANLSRAGTGNNAALINALRRSTQIANTGAENQLVAKGLEAQRGFDAQRAAELAQQNQQILQGRQQLSNELQPALTLLNLLANFGVQSAERTSTKTAEAESSGTQTTKKRGGLLGLF